MRAAKITEKKRGSRFPHAIIAENFTRKSAQRIKNHHHRAAQDESTVLTEFFARTLNARAAFLEQLD